MFFVSLTWDHEMAHHTPWITALNEPRKNKKKPWILRMKSGCLIGILMSWFIIIPYIPLAQLWALFSSAQMSWKNCCQRQPQMLWGDATMAGDAVREATFVDVRVGNLLKSGSCFHQKTEFFSRYQPIMIRYVLAKRADVLMKWFNPLIETMVWTLGK